MLNLEAINHEFPGGTFLIDKKTDQLINASTGINEKNKNNKYKSHQIFSMIALNSIGYTLDEFFKFLKFDVKKGPMLGQCNINFYNLLRLKLNIMLKVKLLALIIKNQKKLVILTSLNLLLKYS